MEEIPLIHYTYTRSYTLDVQYLRWQTEGVAGPYIMAKLRDSCQVVMGKARL
jgi:hypothetical protein